MESLKIYLDKDINQDLIKTKKSLFPVEWKEAFCLIKANLGKGTHGSCGKIKIWHILAARFFITHHGSFVMRHAFT